MKSLWMGVLSVLCSAGIAAAGEPGPSRAEAAAAFDRLKTLAGTWQSDTKDMGKARVEYELVAGGSALIERFSAEKMGQPMITLFHMDGDALRLTHYCMAGNQPTMVARTIGKDGTIAFQFAGAGNLKSANAGHMHDATFRLIDDGRFASRWTFYENGQPKFTEDNEYTRIQ